MKHINKTFYKIWLTELHDSLNKITYDNTNGWADTHEIWRNDFQAILFFQLKDTLNPTLDPSLDLTSKLT